MLFQQIEQLAGHHGTECRDCPAATSTHLLCVPGWQTRQACGSFHRPRRRAAAPPRRASRPRAAGVVANAGTIALSASAQTNARARSSSPAGMGHRALRSSRIGTDHAGQEQRFVAEAARDLRYCGGNPPTDTDRTPRASSNSSAQLPSPSMISAAVGRAPIDGDETSSQRMRRPIGPQSSAGDMGPRFLLTVRYRVADERESDVTCVADVHAVLGEGAGVGSRARPRSTALHQRPEIFSGCRARALERWDTPFRVGSLAPRESGGFIAAHDHGIATVDLDTGRSRSSTTPEAHLPNNRFNAARSIDTADLGGDHGRLRTGRHRGDSNRINRDLQPP